MSTPLSLPIDAILPALCQTLAEHDRCLLVAQPGAGKTTRVPLALLGLTEPGLHTGLATTGAVGAAAKPGKWLLLEPRRVAARLAAAWMAQQLGENLGDTIGYRVRGESRVGPRTRLEVVTQGILTRMLQDDPALEGVTGIIFDEFHERSLDADLGLALALDVQQGLREDLKLLVMSATLDVASLLSVLGQDTPVIECEGRAWPVTTHYRPMPVREIPERHQARVIREALTHNPDGHLLVFLPGQREIRRLRQTLLEALPADTEVRSLHGQMPLSEQQAVLRPPEQGPRRIILSTAIAESSLTVPGVRVVIDAGRERVPVFQPRSGLSRLETRQVNRASADQRRGRAGREAAGACYRLWAEEAQLMPHREAEITQADLAGLVFELIRWGVSDPAALQWVSPPPAAGLAAGQKLLQTLGLVEKGLSDATPTLTALGRRCGRWPTHPRLAVLLEAAQARCCLPLGCWLVAGLEEAAWEQEEDIAMLLLRRPRHDAPGNQGRWWRAARQWADRLGCGLDIADLAPASTLLALAFPDRVVMNQGDGRFRLVTGGQALVPENHPLCRHPLLVAVSLDGQPSGARIFHAIAIDAATLEAIFPTCREWRQQVYWDDQAGRLVGEEIRGLGQVILERKSMKALPAGAASKALLEALRQAGSLPWSTQDQQLLGRLRLLHHTLGEPWPNMSDQALMDGLEQWLLPHLDGLTRLQQVERLDLGELLLHSLDWSLRAQLDKLAPNHLRVPSGSNIRLDYSSGEPVLAVKLQELFGQIDTPRLVDGRVPVLIHLLSPAARPVQVTRDLANFWASTYFEVRKDLKGRYPKHPWPDDPLQAIATRHTKNRQSRLNN